MLHRALLARASAKSLARVALSLIFQPNSSWTQRQAAPPHSERETHMLHSLGLPQGIPGRSGRFEQGRKVALEVTQWTFAEPTLGWGEGEREQS